MEILLMILGALLMALISVIYMTFSWGFVAWKFWYWFLMPIFPMLPAITFVQAMGVMLVISLFRGSQAQIIRDDYVNTRLSTTLSIISPWFVFIIGWLVKIIFF